MLHINKNKLNMFGLFAKIFLFLFAVATVFVFFHFDDEEDEAHDLAIAFFKLALKSSVLPNCTIIFFVIYIFFKLTEVFSKEIFQKTFSSYLRGPPVFS